MSLLHHCSVLVQSVGLFFLSICLLSTTFTLAVKDGTGRVNTTDTTLACTDGTSSMTFVPALAGAEFCSQSNTAACQDAFTPGFPYSYGNVAVATNATMKYNQFINDRPLYIIISDSNGRPAYKVRFFLQVDKFSLLELANSAGDSRWDVSTFANDALIDSTSAAAINGTLISAEWNGFSVPAVRRAWVPDATSSSTTVSNTHRMVVPYYTLLIDLDNGKPNSLSWQTGCNGCSNCWKEEKMCTIPYSTCSDVDSTSSVSCNIKIYVGWTGTDKKGNYMMSGERTFGNFNKFDINLPINKVTGTINLVKKQISKAESKIST